MSAPQYHKVWIPLPDVYDWGGVKSFYELERDEPGQKNLVLVVRNYLSELKNHTREDPLNKGMEAVGFLDRKLAGYSGKRDLAVLPHIEGLDIGLFTGPKGVEEGDLMTLERKVAKHLQREPIFMTGDRTISALLKSRGVKVEPPKWMGGEHVVDNGIIVGGSELLEDLMKNKGVLPLEIAKGYIDKTLGLYQGQVVKFLGQNPVYARVTGELEFAGTRVGGQNALNSKVVGISNPRLEVIKRGKLQIGGHYLDRVLGVKPLDWEQYLALQEGLLNPNVSSMALVGKAGSGKTLLAYAAGIDLVLDYPEEIRAKRGLSSDLPGGFFDQVILFKSINLVGGEERNLGFLPGSLYEKLKPYLESYEDCHAETLLERHMSFEELFCNPNYPTKEFPQRRANLSGLALNKEGGKLPGDRAVIKLAYTGHTRGRTVRRTLVIVDEVQNLKPNEVRTIATRLGQESKIIFLGDTKQIDNPACSHDINGLTYAVQRSQGNSYFRLYKLEKCYRNQVAEDAESW